MWTRGTIRINGITVKYCVKHFEEGSEFGIEGGRISKLSCRVGDEEILNYERGWDIKPKTELARKALARLIKKFN